MFHLILSQKKSPLFEQLPPRLRVRKRFFTAFYIGVAVLSLFSIGANQSAQAPKAETYDCCAQIRQIKNVEISALESQPAQIQILSQDQGLNLAQDATGRLLTVEIKNTVTRTNSQIVIDDSASLKQPIITRYVKDSKVTFDTLESGLGPGVVYYLVVQPNLLRAKFKLRQSIWKSPLPQADYLKKAWQTTGRQWISLYTGVKWNSTKKQWGINPKWSNAKRDVAQQAYYAPYALRGAVNMGAVNHDLELIDELAQFHLVYLQRFTTLGEMRRQGGAEVTAELLLNQGSDESRTLLWLEPVAKKKRVRESVGATIQFLYPASRLLRIITTLPSAEQSPQMKQFVAAYWPLILREQLLRFTHVAHWNYRDKDLPKELISIWKNLLHTAKRKPSYQYAMTDGHLWLVTIAAELLGANANAPQMASLSARELTQLREITAVGVQLFQKTRTLYPDTKNFSGQIVQSASHFNGDMDDHAYMAYANYQGEKFPTPADKNPASNGSWDISHFHRVPIFLRALYDNKKATKLAFPQAQDIKLIVNQYVYRVFQGNYNKPLFNNFFDGNDGWYRVGYHDRDFGYPPSCACDETSKENSRPCLTTGSIQGWSLLTFFNEDLLKLQRAFSLMALSDNVEVKDFRKRYYAYNNQEFAVKNEKGDVTYPLLLFNVLSEMPEQSG